MKNGYYFIKIEEGYDWEPAEYDNGTWQIIGFDLFYNTEDIFEIGKKIEKPKS